MSGGGSMTATGLLLILDHLFTLAAVAALAILVLAVGSTALRIARVDPAGAATRLTFGMVLGSGVVATAILAVSAAAGVGPLQLGGTVLALGWAARRELAAAPGRVPSAGQELLAAHGTGWPRSAAALGVALLVACLLLLALPPATDWDSLAYHLDVPAEWLAAGRLHLPEDNYHVAFVGLVHMLYLPLLAIGAASGPSVLSALFALLAALAAFALAEERFGARTAVIAFWLLWASPIVLLVGSTPRIDVTLAFFLLAAHLAILVAPERGPRYLFLGGVILGMAAGVKYLGALYGLALLPWILLAAWRGAATPGRRTALVGCCGAVALAAWAPWLAKNWVLLGAPLFPYLAPLQVEPWLEPIYGPSLRPEGVDPGVFRYHREMREEIGLVNLFTRPERLGPDPYGPASSPSPVLLLAPVAIMVAGWSNSLAVAGPAILYIGLLLGVSRESALRYLIPALAPLAMNAAVVIRSSWDRTRRWTGVAGVGLLCATAALAVGSVRAPVTERLSGRHLVGAETRAGYLSRYWETSSLLRSTAWLNLHLGAGDQVLLLFEARGYYIRPRHLKDPLLRNLAYVSVPAAVDSCLAGVGVTHILVYDSGLRYFKARGARIPSLDDGAFEQLRSRCLDLVHQDPGFRVWRVRSPAALTPPPPASPGGTR